MKDNPIVKSILKTVSNYNHYGKKASKYHGHKVTFNKYIEEDEAVKYHYYGFSNEFPTKKEPLETLVPDFEINCWFMGLKIFFVDESNCQY